MNPQTSKVANAFLVVFFFTQPKVFAVNTDDFSGHFSPQKNGGGACKLGRVGKKRPFRKKTHILFELSFHEIMRL